MQQLQRQVAKVANWFKGHTYSPSGNRGFYPVQHYCDGSTLPRGVIYSR